MKFNVVGENKKTFKDVRVGQIFLADEMYWLKINETSVGQELYEYEMANVIAMGDGAFYAEHFNDNDIIEKIYTNITINLA